MTALSNLQVYDYIENIDFTIVHRMGERATAPVSVLPVRLAMLSTALTHPCVHSISMSYTKKHQGLAIALFFCIWKYLCSGCMDAQERISYAKQTGKANLYAAQLRILGL